MDNILHLCVHYVCLFTGVGTLQISIIINIIICPGPRLHAVVPGCVWHGPDQVSCGCSN